MYGKEYTWHRNVCSSQCNFLLKYLSPQIVFVTSDSLYNLI